MHSRTFSSGSAESESGVPGAQPGVFRSLSSALAIAPEWQEAYLAAAAVRNADSSAGGHKWVASCTLLRDCTPAHRFPPPPPAGTT